MQSRTSSKVLAMEDVETSFPLQLSSRKYKDEEQSQVRNK